MKNPLRKLTALLLLAALPLHGAQIEIKDIPSASSAAGTFRLWGQLSGGGAGTDRSITLDNLFKARTGDDFNLTGDLDLRSLDSITVGTGANKLTLTGSSLGTGASVIGTQTGGVLGLKSLVAGTNVTLSTAANTITISATGGGGGGDQTPWASNIAGAGFNLSGAGTVAATLFSGSGANLTALNASNVTSGSLGLARIAQGGAATGQLLGWNGTAYAPVWPTTSIKAAATYATAGDTQFTGGNWFHAGTVSSGTFARNLLLSPAGVTTGERADILLEVGTGTQRLRVYSGTVASGTALFDYQSVATAAARGLASFIHTGGAWIAAAPNVMSEYAASGGSAESETAPSFAGLTTPARYYAAATFAASADATAIATWTGLAGSPNATATSGAQATKRVLGSFNVLRFDGVNDFYSFTPLTTFTNWTVAIVVKATAPAGILVGASGDLTQILATAFSPGTVASYDGTTQIFSDAADVTSGLTLITAKCTSGVVTFARNGVAVGGGTDFDDTALTAALIGAADATGSAPAGFLTADIAVLAIWPTAISDLAGVTTLLMTHFGL